MTSSNSNLPSQLFELTKHYAELFQQKHGHLPVVEKDEQWPSPCIKGSFSEDAELWSPEPVKDELTFDNVERALGFALHQDIKTFFTSVYSESFDLQSEDGKLTLLFPWSEADFERLQENIIGHILMKQKLKQPETVFFALTDQEDYILSVDNASGEVWVEQVGKVAHKKIADDLSSFISSVTPVIYD